MGGVYIDADELHFDAYEAIPIRRGRNKGDFMNMSFSFIANEAIPYINTAVFVIDGDEITIDRDRTLYTYNPEAGEMVMDWIDCYVWNGEIQNFDIPDGFEERAILKELEIEDDAPLNYEIQRVRWCKLKDC